MGLLHKNPSKINDQNYRRLYSILIACLAILVPHNISQNPNILNCATCLSISVNKPNMLHDANNEKYLFVQCNYTKKFSWYKHDIDCGAKLIQSSIQSLLSMNECIPKSDGACSAFLQSLSLLVNNRFKMNITKQSFNNIHFVITDLKSSNVEDYLVDLNPRNVIWADHVELPKNMSEGESKSFILKFPVKKLFNRESVTIILFPFDEESYNTAAVCGYPKCFVLLTTKMSIRDLKYYRTRTR